MRFKKRLFRIINILGITSALVLVMSLSVFAQGSITGTVQNSDLSTPANGEIFFFGFLDGTDEEIRIESCVGAGYDNGNWYDDFQNYLTEAPGNPYVYYFYNTVNNEGYQLAGTIPSNSYQQENITLASVTWASRPTGLTATAVSSSSMVISWQGVAGLTYHVYRRNASSSGSFFRIDNTSGDTGDPGVADGFFVDNTVNGASSYDYLVIAEDALGNYSEHSDVITGNSASIDAPVVISVDPDNGPAVGNTFVNIYGSGFDMAGADAVIGTSSLTSLTVVSPFHITGSTQTGTIGVADVYVTNTASGLVSNTLTGGYTYNANAAPTLASIGSQAVTEGELLTFVTSASDPEGGTPAMTSSTLPGTAAYVDNLDGTGTFSWRPTYLEAGTQYVTFYATDDVDPLLVDSEAVEITIDEAGNQTPVIDPIAAQAVAEGGSLNFTVTASDPEGVPPALEALDLPANATFVDNTDGTGTFGFNPAMDQEGLYTVTFVATDDSAATYSLPVEITVTATNQLPVLAEIGAQTTDEDVTLNFTVSATDDDGDIPVLTTSALPTGAVFTDLLDGTGTFDWTPTFTDSGTYDITFYATDAVYATDVDSEVVVITVNGVGNQMPVLASVDSQWVAEGGTLSLTITASDPDSTFAVLTAENVPTNATFVDNLDGTGTFDFNPDYTQGGEYTVTIIAADNDPVTPLADTGTFVVTVVDEGNLPPVIDSIGNFAVNEGDSVFIDVTASDPDGAAPDLTVSTTLNNYTFMDNGDGTGQLVYRPDFYDGGLDTVRFIAIDNGTPQQSSTEISVITTVEVNQAPVIDSVGPFSVKTDRLLTFTIVAHDSTDADPAHHIFLTADNVPVNAIFTDNNDNTGTFEFNPVPGQEGLETVTFFATDNGTPQLTTSLNVEITVVGVNVPPVLSEIGPQTVTEGETLEVVITATDPEGTIPAILAAGMPDNSSIVDSGNGTAVFTFTPNYVQSGLHSVTFKAYDGIDIDKEVVLIQVYEAGNQVPEFTLIPSPQAIEGEIYEDIIMAADPDSTPVEIFIDASFSTIESFELVDSGNGVASFTVVPTYVQAGLWDVWLVVSDGELADTAVMTIEVIDAGNQPPVLNEITDKSVLEGETLEFTITASDPDLTIPALSAGNLPGDALFYDYQIGEGIFNWTPDATEHGDYEVMFYAIDADSAELIDSQAVTITVIDSNYTPNVYPDPIYQTSSVDEGDTLFYVVKGTDPDGDFPLLGARMSTGEIGDPLVSNMSFYDSANGHGVLTFAPDYTQGNNNPTKYYLAFYVIDAMDGTKINQYTGVTLNVYQKNAIPTMSFEAGTDPFSIAEGGSLAFNVLAEDADGTPTITVEDLPTNASVNGDADSVYFEFNPDYTQSGQYTIRFIVTDNVMAADSQEIEIEVIEAGNQKVVFTSGPGEQVDAAVNIPREIEVAAYDPEGEAITLTATPIVSGATFTNNGDGTGLYSFTPTSIQLDSTYVVTFIAQDLSLTADTLETNLRVVILMRGDADASRQYTMNDIVYLISYIYRDGPEPTLLEAADVDDSGDINVFDVAYLVSYFYNSGPKPPQ